MKCTFKGEAQRANALSQESNHTPVRPGALRTKTVISHFQVDSPFRQVFLIFLALLEMFSKFWTNFDILAVFCNYLINFRYFASFSRHFNKIQHKCSRNVFLTKFTCFCWFFEDFCKFLQKMMICSVFQNFCQHFVEFALFHKISLHLEENSKFWVLSFTFCIFCSVLPQNLIFVHFQPKT